MKRKKPATPGKWILEIVEAYKDAEEASPFGPAPDVGVDLNDDDHLFHFAPVVCLKFRGLKQSQTNLKRATEAALSSYVATESLKDGITTTPYMSFAFCYIASHYGVGLMKEKEANELIQYVNTHQDKLRELISA